MTCWQHLSHRADNQPKWTPGLWTGWQRHWHTACVRGLCVTHHCCVVFSTVLWRSLTRLLPLDSCCLPLYTTSSILAVKPRAGATHIGEKVFSCPAGLAGWFVDLHHGEHLFTQAGTSGFTVDPWCLLWEELDQLDLLLHLCFFTVIAHKWKILYPDSLCPFWSNKSVAVSCNRYGAHLNEWPRFSAAWVEIYSKQQAWMKAFWLNLHSLPKVNDL